MARSPERSFQRLVEIMSRLRRDCPWDRAQTTRSILPYLVEETYEVLEALESGPPDEVRGELGDLLLQILFHSELASERNEFDVTDVIDAVCEKMVRRHPHVFGDVEATTADEVLRNWSRIKAAERSKGAERPPSVLDGVPATLPALLRAERLGEKASRVGFDWSHAREVLAKVREEVAELEEALAGGDANQIEDELGDCLFALVSFGRKASVSAEIALRGTLARFQERFTRIEERLRAEGKDIHTASLAELEELWQRAKAG